MQVQMLMRRALMREASEYTDTALLLFFPQKALIDPKNRAAAKKR